MDEVGFGVARWDAGEEGGILDGADADGTGRALRNTQLLCECLSVPCAATYLERKDRPSVNNRDAVLVREFFLDSNNNHVFAGLFHDLGLRAKYPRCLLHLLSYP